jgi:hypothetical protein
VNALAPAARLERQRRHAAAAARIGRLRRWLSRLETRAVSAREAKQELSEALLAKLLFVRGQLRKAERRAFELREQMRKEEGRS